MRDFLNVLIQELKQSIQNRVRVRRGPVREGVKREGGMGEHLRISIHAISAGSVTGAHAGIGMTALAVTTFALFLLVATTRPLIAAITTTSVECSRAARAVLIVLIGCPPSLQGVCVRGDVDGVLHHHVHARGRGKTQPFEVHLCMHVRG